MGRSYLFQCPRCRLRAVVSGGADQGVHCCVQTIHCRDCAALHDVPVRLRVAAGEVPLPQRLQPRLQLNRPLRLPAPVTGWDRRLPFGGSAKHQWVAIELRCPVSPLHRVKPWKDPGGCPRCGHRLERALVPAREWE